METQEISQNSVIEIMPEAKTQDDYQLMNMIRSIKASSKDEVRVELDTLQVKVENLQKQLSSTTQRLEPLLRFEPILNANIREPMTVNLFDLSDNDKEKLLALARHFYPNKSRVFDGEQINFKGRGRDPLNQMLSDLMSFLLIGPTEQCMLASFFRGNRQRGLVINDN